MWWESSPPGRIPARRRQGLRGRPTNAAGSLLLTALVLVGVPLGVLAVGRETASKVHPASTRVMIERQIRAELRREGVKQVQCGWTSDPTLTVSCNGTRSDGSTEGDDAFVIGQDGR